MGADLRVYEMQLHRIRQIDDVIREEVVLIEDKRHLRVDILLVESNLRIQPNP